MLPTLVLHKTAAVAPYKRGFYCSDDSIRYTFKSSTVPSSVLVAVGILLPTISVSGKPPRRENAENARHGTPRHTTQRNARTTPSLSLPGTGPVQQTNRHDMGTRRGGRRGQPWTPHR